MPARQTVLFLIRDKMGDSLIAANVALAFARAHPEWAVSVLIRDVYAHAIVGEPLIETITFRGGIHARLLAWRWRLTGRRFDVLGVMRGVGERTMDLVKSIPAGRVVVHDARLARVATEVATGQTSTALAPGPGIPHYEPALRVARALAADLPPPPCIRFDALANRWQATAKRYIAICPLSDEPRRNIPAPALDALYGWLRARHPDREIKVLVRNKEELRRLAQKPAAPVTFFNDMPGLLRILLESSQYYGADTGTMHLAAGMGLPCTVFFGPTQPHLVLPRTQPGIVAVRLPALGARHCDVKSCPRADCIALAVSQHIGNARPDGEPLPPACPLRETGAG